MICSVRFALSVLISCTLPMRTFSSEIILLFFSSMACLRLSRFLSSISNESVTEAGIYVGQGMVCFLEPIESTLLGKKFQILFESLENERWKGWTKRREGKVQAAEKALMEYQAYVQGVADNYHLNGKNCQHFTEYCLNTGIGSSYPK